MTVTDAWINYDNSLSVRLSGYPPVAVAVLKALGLLDRDQTAYIEFCRANDIRFCDATKRIPHTDQSVDSIYTSHMLEHLSRDQAVRFLAEARRVLKARATLRIAVPDLSKAIDTYKKNGDADALMAGILVAAPPLESLRDKVKLLATGYRHHQWMYDGPSLIKLLEENGFSEPKILPAGATTIADPGALNLYERAEESVYVEAKKL